MIVGIGLDIIDTARVHRLLTSKGTRFINRICRPEELTRQINSPVAYAQYMAGRLAAKEAVSKALGTGILGTRVGWHDIEITNSQSGQPVVKLHNHAANIAAEKGIDTIHLSISHIKDYAIAVAIAENTSSAIPVQKVHNDSR